MNGYIVSVLVVYSGNLLAQFSKLDMKVVVALFLIAFCIHSVSGCLLGRVCILVIVRIILS